MTDERRLGPDERTRAQIEQIMRRVGLAHRIDDARRRLPEIVDLDRDSALLLELGLSIDSIANDLGAGPW